MKKSEKQKYILKLMVIALNDAIKKERIDLNGRSENKQQEKKYRYQELVIAGRRTIINWLDAGHDELRISVWWDYQPEMMPTWRKQYIYDCEPTTATPQVARRFFRHILGACGSCYLERKTGKFFIGDEGNQFLDVYVNEDSVSYLNSIPAEEPQGYSTHGWIKE
ncbi:hypothetical protein [Xenorhabdus bovienii]|uniref:hypothetical protein n=1 Tax=Xenorhabdus bovienii TaxID=40576 RepID=UPI0023B29B5A|nr:hypothetical protein [Xenorhabdus bovienii]